jgi:hypothetical protein
MTSTTATIKRPLTNQMRLIYPINRNVATGGGGCKSPPTVNLR